MNIKKLHAFAIAALCCLSAGAAVVEDVSIHTESMPPAEAVTVVVPEGYDPGTRFPVVYLLNGYDGNNRQWLTTQKRLPELADAYGMIFVLPDGRDSWYWDSPIDPQMQMETFLTAELPAYIDANYPTKADRRYRAITGLSMGGHGALWTAMRHPDIFGSAGSMSGVVDVTPFAGKYKTSLRLGDKNADPAIWQSHSVISLVPELQPGEINITIDCGIDDPFATVNDNLHRALVEHGIPHDYTSRPGGHSHPYWANSLLYHLLYFNEIFKK